MTAIELQNTRSLLWNDIQSITDSDILMNIQRYVSKLLDKTKKKETTKQVAQYKELPLSREVEELLGSFKLSEEDIDERTRYILNK